MPKIYKAGNQINSKIVWGNRTYEQCFEYAKICNECISSYKWPDLFCDTALCNNTAHRNLIDAYYSQIVSSIVQAAKLSHRGSTSIYKKKRVIGWNFHLKECHSVARSYYQLWNIAGRPTQGQIYNDMIHSKRVFKNKIKWCQFNENKIKMDVIATHRYNKDFSNFWKETNKLNYKTSLPLSVNGIQDATSIANMFVNKFNPPPPTSHLPTVATSASRGVHHVPGPPAPAPPSILSSDDSNEPCHVTAEDLFSCVKQMKRGKSPGHDGLSVEHLMNAPAVVFEKLATLFNSCIEHSYLPANCMKTIVVPIIKNRTGDASNLSNYRPISLATILSKVFENIIIKHLNERNIPLNNAQFGFRRGLSTDFAIFTLKNTLYHYINRHTTTYACFLDLSRAFDTINYNKLWSKLRNTKVPDKIVNLLEYWYANQVNQVRWDKSLSDTYKLSCGVRQGGLTSPVLFNLYVNDLIEELSSTRVGCRIGGVSLNNISYADDMVLLSPSVNGLRKLITICEKYAAEHQLTYNVAKTEIVIFKSGKGPDTVLPINLCGLPIKIVSQFKYLGHIIKENLVDDEDLERQRRSIASRSNMLARRFYHCSKQVKITLFKAYCQSFYTSQLWCKHTKSAYNTLRVQYNNAFRAMLHLPWRCSATDMFAESGVADFFTIMTRLKDSFFKRVSTTSNTLVEVVYKTVYLYKNIR